MNVYTDESRNDETQIYRVMQKYIYQGKAIEYAGFKMDNKYCFYYDDIIIYLSQNKVDKLTKI